MISKSIEKSRANKCFSRPDTCSCTYLLDINYNNFLVSHVSRLTNHCTLGQARTKIQLYSNKATGMQSHVSHQTRDIVIHMVDTFIMPHARTIHDALYSKNLPLHKKTSRVKFITTILLLAQVLVQIFVPACTFALQHAACTSLLAPLLAARISPQTARGTRWRAYVQCASRPHAVPLRVAAWPVAAK